MLDKIKLINFQSHKNTEIILNPGINVIIGSSDNGKSAILRGLFWAIYNQPSGDAYVSNWCRNDKGRQVEQTNVIIEKEGKTISKGRGSELNGYDFNGKKYTALGKNGVPPQIYDFFNIEKVNIQKQMDPPFLIADSPPEKAKFLNSIVDMSEIDSYLSLAESKKRSSNKDKQNLKVEITSLQTQLEKLEPLDYIDKLIKKESRINDRLNKKKQALQALKTNIDTYTQLKEKVYYFKDMGQIQELLKQIKDLNLLIEEKRKYKKLISSINEYNENKEKIGVETIEDAQFLLNKISVISNKYREKNSQYISITKDILNYEKTQKIINRTKIITKLQLKLNNIKETKQEILKNKDLKLQKTIDNYEAYKKLYTLSIKSINNLKQKLPDICPLCKHPLEEE